MTTLILGHSYYYTKDNVRCSPVDVNSWYDKPFDCVDFMCDKETTDFVYDIFRSIDYRYENKISYDGFWVWKFAEDNSYDIIIDCTGAILLNKPKKEYRYQNDLLKTILRVLRPNGIFHSFFGSYKKQNDTLSFTPYA
jgi:hypothetical protein